MKSRSNGVAPAAVALMFVAVGAWLILTCGSCGGGGGGDTPGTGNATAFTVTDASPPTVASEIPQPLEVTGTGFEPVGGTATIRVGAMVGDPFMGHSDDTVEFPATIVSDTLIRGDTVCFGASDDIPARLTVVLPDLREVTTGGPMLTVECPRLTMFAPSDARSGQSVPFVLTGTGLGDAGSSVVVRFTATTGAPFVGGMQPSAEVVGTVGSSTVINGMTPIGVTTTPVTVWLTALWPSGASVPTTGPVFTILPFTTFPFPGAVAGAQFGGAMAVEGDIAAIGTPGDGSGGVYVYMWDGTQWVYSGIFAPGDLAANAKFGAAMAISGNTVVVGAPEDDAAGNKSGSAYVFVWDGSNWSQQAKLIAPDGNVQDKLGSAVAIDGDTIALGAPNEEDPGGNRAGAVYVYDRAGGLWSLTQKLYASDPGVQDCLGGSVAIEGDVIVAGAEGHDDVASNSGAAYVFARSGGVWSEQQRLKASDASTDAGFGHALALDGGTVLIGAPHANAVTLDAGAAYVFVGPGGIWSEQAKLFVPTGATGDAFGAAVALAGDIAVVGAPQRDGAAADEGRAYRFERSGALWTLTAELQAPSPVAGDLFGAAVSINNGQIFVGAPGLDTHGADAGGVFVY